MDITTIVILIIGIIGSIIGLIFIPYLIKKFGKEKVQESLATLQYIISIGKLFAQAVEQMYPEWDGEAKLEYVTSKIKTELEKQNITFDETKIRAAIEQAVFNINNSINENDENLNDTNGSINNDTNSTYNPKANQVTVGDIIIKEVEELSPEQIRELLDTAVNTIKDATKKQTKTSLSYDEVDTKISPSYDAVDVDPDYDL